MSPLELIKNGVINNDMGLVINGYEALTGEKLKENKVKVKIDLKSGWVNKFVDDLNLFPPSKKDKEIAKKLGKFRKTKGMKRPPAKKVKAVCNTCKRSYEIYEKYLPPKFDKEDESSYICNRCIPKK